MDSNHRHVDFQSTALPTELSGHKIQKGPRIGVNDRHPRWAKDGFYSFITPDWSPTKGEVADCDLTCRFSLMGQVKRPQ